MLNLSLKELKAIAKIRGIKVYKGMSKDRLLSALILSKTVEKSGNSFDDTKPKINFSKSRIEEMNLI